MEKSTQALSVFVNSLREDMISIVKDILSIFVGCRKYTIGCGNCGHEFSKSLEGGSDSVKCPKCKWTNTGLNYFKYSLI